MCTHYTYMFWPEPRGQEALACKASLVSQALALSVQVGQCRLQAGWPGCNRGPCSHCLAVPEIRTGRDSTAAVVLWARL